MMAKDPVSRHQSPREVAEALAPFFKKPPTGAPAAAVALVTPDSTRPATVPDVEPDRGTWAGLIELKETEPLSSSGHTLARSRSRRLRPTVVAAGLATILLGVVLFGVQSRKTGPPGHAVGLDQSGKTDRSSGAPSRDRRDGDITVGTSPPQELVGSTRTDPGPIGPGPIRPGHESASSRDLADGVADTDPGEGCRRPPL